MPYLRFTRDRRGYENTFLIHTYRRRGRKRSKLLYWFRTPPHVQVGRAPFDPDAIRAIEQGNPEVTFDWDAILRAHASRGSGERALPEPPRRARRGQAEAIPQRSDEAPPRAAAPAALDTADSLEVADVQMPGGEPASEPWDEGEEELAGVPPSTSSPATAAVESLIGAEGLTRLRARIAELRARIAEAVPDPAAQEAVRQQAELLDPDTWVTLDEAREGLEHYESRYDELRRVLGKDRPGRHPRRRRGRRRGQSSGEPSSGAPPPGA